MQEDSRTAFLQEALFRPGKDSERFPQELSKEHFITAAAKSHRKTEQYREKTNERKERQSERTELKEKILKVAESKRGAELWKPDYVNKTNNGDFGCAVAVSKVLKESGVDTGILCLAPAKEIKRLEIF